MVKVRRTMRNNHEMPLTFLMRCSLFRNGFLAGLLVLTAYTASPANFVFTASSPSNPNDWSDARNRVLPL